MLYLHVFAIAVAVYLYLVQGSGEGGVFLICQFDVRRAEVFRDAALAAHSGVPSTRHGNLPCKSLCHVVAQTLSGSYHYDYLFIQTYFIVRCKGREDGV